MSVISVVTLTTLILVTHPENASQSNAMPSGSLAAKTAFPATQSPPNRWLTSYTEATQLAARHKLPLVLHFDAPWCGACRTMEQNVLYQSQVTGMLGTKVVGVKLNADTNKDLIAEFQITSLPTEVVVLGDGSRGSRFKGAATLNEYVARLNSISGASSAAIARTAGGSDIEAGLAANLRSCLIVRRDGKMVGMGGYSPVSFKKDKAWKRGVDTFVVTHEGVDYYLTSTEEVDLFNGNPDWYVPKFHGCDPVEMTAENRATSGAIEFGSFYDGQMFFFSTRQNRTRFEQNPRWFLALANQVNAVNEEDFPFLKTISN
ncbi:MAG: thioredoxin domain-containing protein [Planctomycetaceae bacterium]